MRELVEKGQDIMNFWQALEEYAVTHLRFHTNQLRAADEALHLKNGTLEGASNALLAPLAASALVSEVQAVAPTVSEDLLAKENSGRLQ